MRTTLRSWSVPIAVLVSAIVVALHIVELPAMSQAARRLVDASHAPGFGLVALAALLFLRSRTTVRNAYLVAFGLTFMLALASEALQVFGPRNADIADLGRGMLGAFGFLALVASSDPKLQPRLGGGRWAVLLLGVVATILALTPIAQSVRVLNARANALPFIAGFDESWETAIYKPLGATTLTAVRPPAGWPVTEGRVLEVGLMPIQYSGVSIEPYADWTEFESLSFLAASADGKTHGMTVRIHDATHNWEHEDRFNVGITIERDVRRYEIPLADIRGAVAGREFDFSRVADITFFKVNAVEGDTILIDDIRLR